MLNEDAYLFLNIQDRQLQVPFGTQRQARNLQTTIAVSFYV